MIKIQTLKLDDDARTPQQIEIDKARIEGYHAAIKMMINEIRKVEHHMKCMGYKISRDFIDLKNNLGVLVYSDWTYED